MTDYQLEAHIDHFKLLIHEAEKTLEYRRIALGAGEIEKAERGSRKLRGLKLNTPQGVVKISGTQLKSAANPTAKTSVADILAKFKAAGITPEKIKAVIEARKAKEMQNAPRISANPGGTEDGKGKG
jgi:hypothetical protein